MRTLSRFFEGGISRDEKPRREKKRLFTTNIGTVPVIEEQRVKKFRCEINIGIRQDTKKTGNANLS
jgi:hypothetical protein